MHIHVYEKTILGLTLVILVAALGAIGGSVFAGHAHLPGPVMRVDPRTVAQTPPFDAPGVQQLGPNHYLVVMTAQAWSFNPTEVTVPAGSMVTFQIASVDVTHGFLIEDTNVNLTLIPGYVSAATTTFSTPGTYLIVCHEYCGLGHQAMYGRVVVQ